MPRNIFVIAAALLLAACATPPSSARGPAGLRKISYRSATELERIRQSGAEIIVQQPDYVVVRTDSAQLAALGLPSQPAVEQDLVQRLVAIVLRDSTSLQTVVDSGVDLWEAHGDTALARTFDIQLEKLRQQGLTITIIAENADEWRKERR
ncbi:MAG: hypothetical protein ONB48_13735 [candidate division KSB1 bacterium]|nr:hypothetical protein [candidate division KSB1 bacterium]MDZ7276508.1 hypothetical protein [candidate division KSB1 bacterium]MDZ7286711.1 hypothetical protein [candidate division KSB1 bacterium]MDZ7300278.1 hypothetical protein [candidate division KSB1 bacterium]MDZ7307879.1 hypothetical protein [candidate division KSB1 bacterium]